MKIIFEMILFFRVVLISHKIDETERERDTCDAANEQCVYGMGVRLSLIHI